MTKYDGKELAAIFKFIIETYGDMSAEEYDKLDINKPGRATLARHFGGWHEAKMAAMSARDDDQEIVQTNVKLAKERQRLMDSNRIERKAFRNYARIENAMDEVTREFTRVLETHSIKDYSPEIDDNDADAVGIFHLTDAHFNELVDIKENHYDFDVAARRCKKFVSRAMVYFDANDIKTVVFAMTGDMLNSDRRLDEILNQATNRTRAMFLAVELIKQMIQHLNTRYNVYVLAVSGNESRMQKDMAFSDSAISDNYDYCIYNVLRQIFKDADGVRFIGDATAERVVNINGSNILFSHGIWASTKVEESVQKIRGKYAAQDVVIDYVVIGHKHSARLADSYARGGSIVGANAYSSDNLQLASRASQNVYIVFDDGAIEGVKIDLQNTDGYHGYDITDELVAYNAKSAKKAHAKVYYIQNGTE